MNADEFIQTLELAVSTFVSALVKKCEAPMRELHKSGSGVKTDGSIKGFLAPLDACPTEAAQAAYDELVRIVIHETTRVNREVINPLMQRNLHHVPTMINKYVLEPACQKALARHFPPPVAKRKHEGTSS